MDSSMRIGIICGFMVGIILVIILLKVTKNDHSIRCKFDERQQIVRGRGFKYGFFGWMIYDAGYILLDCVLEKKYLDTAMALFLGLVVGILVYALYCIWHEGYISMNENAGRLLLVFLLICIINLAIGGMHIYTDGLLEDGVLTFLNGANLAVGIAFILILAVWFVKWMTAKREEK